MDRLGLKARYPKRFKVTTNSNHNEVISANSLDRKFDVVAPNQVWTTDITYIWTQGEAGSMLQLPLIYFPGKSWVGLLQTICEQHCVLGKP